MGPAVLKRVIIYQADQKARLTYYCWGMVRIVLNGKATWHCPTKNPTEYKHNVKHKFRKGENVNFLSLTAMNFCFVFGIQPRQIIHPNIQRTYVFEISCQLETFPSIVETSIVSFSGSTAESNIRQYTRKYEPTVKRRITITSVTAHVKRH